MDIQKNNLADLLMVEVHRGWSRQTRALADQAGVDVPMGTVLAKVAGKYQPIDFGGTGGAEVPAAVLAEDKLAVNDDVSAVVIERGVVLNSAALIWPVGATTPQKTAALATLEALGILAHASL